LPDILCFRLRLLPAMPLRWWCPVTVTRYHSSVLGFYSCVLGCTRNNALRSYVWFRCQITLFLAFTLRSFLHAPRLATRGSYSRTVHPVGCCSCALPRSPTRLRCAHILVCSLCSAARLPLFTGYTYSSHYCWSTFTFVACSYRWTFVPDNCWFLRRPALVPFIVGDSSLVTAFATATTTLPVYTLQLTPHAGEKDIHTSSHFLVWLPRAYLTAVLPQQQHALTTRFAD